MAAKASAAKAAKQAQGRQKTNRLLRDRLELALKQARAEKLPEVFALIDKATKIHLFHPRKAARLKSQLALRTSQGKRPLKPKKKGLS